LKSFKWGCPSYCFWRADTRWHKQELIHSTIFRGCGTIVISGPYYWFAVISICTICTTLETLHSGFSCLDAIILFYLLHPSSTLLSPLFLLIKKRYWKECVSLDHQHSNAVESVLLI
jgi:hypothetical protein